MPDPSAQDRRNADLRAEIAAKQRREYDEAMTLAREAGLVGYRPWMKLVLLESDHHRTGNREARAVCFKVYRGRLRLTEASMYVRRMEDGTAKAATTPEELFGDLLTEKHPTYGFADKAGVWHP